MNPPTTLRKTILRMAYNASSVHIGCSFSLVEIAHVLYTKFINTKKLISLAPDRDYLCLSKGHEIKLKTTSVMDLCLQFSPIPM